MIVNLAEEGHEIVANLRHLALKPHPCYRDGNQVDPVNLYHKVGHGKLDMYVISPARDSQAVKEFLAKWSSNDCHLFSNTGKKTAGKAFEFPLQNLVSICALLVWQPADPNDNITRILFPGSTPQHKIFEGLEKLRHLEFLKHPVCSARSISPSASNVTVSRSLSKTRQSKIIDNKQNEPKPTVLSKSQTKPTKTKLEKTPPKEVKTKVDTNKLADEKKEIDIIDKKEIEESIKKLDNRILSKDEQIENIKKEIHKIEQVENEENKKKIVHRSKYDMRNVKSKVDSRAPGKSVDRKKTTEKKIEGDSSPPGTPKKGLINGTATKTEKAKVTAKTNKASSPLSTPAKSAKEANNRKVVEARVTSRSSSRSLTRKKEEIPPPLPPTSTINAALKTERKPISRRPKAPVSPVKIAGTKKETESVPKKISKKPDVNMVMGKAIGQKISKELQKGVAIEKTEVQENKESKVDENTLVEVTENKETELMAVKKQMQTAQTKESTNTKSQEEEEEEEVEEEEEYLIITKEESPEDSIKDNEIGEAEEQIKDEAEGEIKKLLREEEESEKKKNDNKAREEETDVQRVEEKKKQEMPTLEGKNKENEKKTHLYENEVSETVIKPDESIKDTANLPKESEFQKQLDGEEAVDLKESGENCIQSVAFKFIQKCFLLNMFDVL